MVSVKMVTYNHEKYIEQAIKSILDQKTSFKFELVIGDDCSEDGTSEIIEKYKKEFPASITYIRHENRIGPYENNLFTIEACNGKYMAFCDGDDFWANQNKLQKQVDYLEANPDVGMVYSNVNIVDEDSEQLREAPVYEDSYQSGDIFWPLMKNCFINANTTCIKSNLVDDLLPRSEHEKKKYWYIYDYWLWLRLANEVKIDYLEGTTASYRIHKQNLSRNASFFKKRAPLVRLDAISTLKRKDLDTKEKQAFVFGKLMAALAGSHFNVSMKLRALGNLIRLRPPISIFALKYKNHLN